MAVRLRALAGLILGRVLRTTLDYAEKVRTQFLSLRQVQAIYCLSNCRRAQSSEAADHRTNSEADLFLPSCRRVLEAFNDT